jgi:hypothetical protein
MNFRAAIKVLVSFGIWGPWCQRRPTVRLTSEESAPYHLFTNIRRDSKLQSNEFYYQARRLRGRRPHMYQRIPVLRIYTILDFGFSYFSYEAHVLSNTSKKIWLLNQIFQWSNASWSDRQTNKQVGRQRIKGIWKGPLPTKQTNKIITKSFGQKMYIINYQLWKLKYEDLLRCS